MARSLAFAPAAIALVLAACGDSPDDRFDFGAPAFLQRWDFHRVEPRAAAVGPDGTVFVAAVDSVYCFSLTGDFLRAWGAPPDDPGKTTFAVWLETGSGGEVAVSDGRTLRLFTPEGTFHSRWDVPRRVRAERFAVGPGGTVLVAPFTSDSNNQILRFTNEGSPLPSLFVAAHDSAVSAVHDVAVARNGDVLAAVHHTYFDPRRWGATLDRYASDGALLVRRPLESSYVRLAAGDAIYVLDGSTIFRLSDSLEEVSHWVTDSYSETIAAVPASGVLVFDSYDATIRVFDPQGVGRVPWHTVPPRGSLGLQVPAIGANGIVYTLDPVLARVARLDGANITTWGRKGSGIGEFVRPTDLDVDESGYVYVADAGNGRIQKFTGTGEWVKTWSDPFPARLAVRGGTVGVASYGAVRSYSTDGIFLGSFVSAPWYMPRKDLQLDLAGRLYLLTEGNQPSDLMDVRAPNGMPIRAFDLAARPENFAIDDRRWIYIIVPIHAHDDRMVARAMTWTGVTLGEWDLTAERPAYLDADPQGRIVVTSTFGSVFLHAPFGMPVTRGGDPLSP